MDCHLVYEIVDNAVMKHWLVTFAYESHVDINRITPLQLQIMVVEIPVGINHKAGIPAVEVVFTILRRWQVRRWRV